MQKKYYCSSVFPKFKQNSKQSCIPRRFGSSELSSHLRLQSFMLISDWKEEERTGSEPGTQLLQSISSSLTYTAGKQLSLLCLLVSAALSQTPQRAQAVQFVLSGLQCGDLCPGLSFPCFPPCLRLSCFFCCFSSFLVSFSHPQSICCAISDVFLSF